MYQLLSANKVGDFMDNNHITYTSPTFDFGGASITFDLGYASDANDTETGDGGTPGETVHMVLVKKLV